MSSITESKKATDLLVSITTSYGLLSNLLNEIQMFDTKSNKSFAGQIIDGHFIVTINGQQSSERFREVCLSNNMNIKWYYGVHKELIINGHPINQMCDELKMLPGFTRQHYLLLDSITNHDIPGRGSINLNSAGYFEEPTNYVYFSWFKSCLRQIFGKDITCKQAKSLLNKIVNVKKWEQSYVKNWSGMNSIYTKTVVSFIANLYQQGLSIADAFKIAGNFPTKTLDKDELYSYTDDYWQVYDNDKTAEEKLSQFKKVFKPYIDDFIKTNEQVDCIVLGTRLHISSCGWRTNANQFSGVEIDGNDILEYAKNIISRRNASINHVDEFIELFKGVRLAENFRERVIDYMLFHQEGVNNYIAAGRYVCSCNCLPLYNEDAKKCDCGKLFR